MRPAGPFGVKPPGLDRNIHPAGLFLVWVKVDDSQYDTGQVFGVLAVAYQIVIVGSVEPEVTVAL